MSTKDGFIISSFKLLLSVVAIVIMLPMVDNLTDISFYVTVSVYVLGKFVELVDKVMGRPFKIFYVIYIIGIIIGVVAVSMCFYAFASSDGLGQNTFSLLYNQILLIMVFAFGFIDVADFVFCICKQTYTREKLKQFN